MSRLVPLSRFVGRCIARDSPRSASSEHEIAPWSARADRMGMLIELHPINLPMSPRFTIKPRITINGTPIVTRLVVAQELVVWDEDAQRLRVRVAEHQPSLDSAIGRVVELHPESQRGPVQQPLTQIRFRRPWTSTALFANGCARGKSFGVVSSTGSRYSASEGGLTTVTFTGAGSWKRRPRA